uniref:Uncharacterized protein n=1 Tax=Acrobeloides nanus TaxID=290746 RepID=A0A914DQI3_9BILA
IRGIPGNNDDTRSMSTTFNSSDQISDV